jgi:hypothetical protein
VLVQSNIASFIARLKACANLAQKPIVNTPFHANTAQCFLIFSGKCNSDFTDCDCSDEKVSLKEYTLCAEETICRLDCQRQGMSTGVCKGKEEWECTCITKNEVEGKTNNSQEMDVFKNFSVV